jgi:Zn finger protein HypA/HybF involved in hydrogenase expression
MSIKIKTNWINVRSSSYVNIDTKVTSKDDSVVDIEQLINCPVCLNIIFDKDNLFECPQCLQNTCLTCKYKIEKLNSQFVCPLCRHTIEVENNSNNNFIQNVLLLNLLKFFTFLFVLVLILLFYVLVFYYL